MSANVAEHIDGLTREDAERLAAGVLRDVARETTRRHRNVVTAVREASQLTHLALRLESFAGAPGGEPRPEATLELARRYWRESHEFVCAHRHGGLCASNGGDADCEYPPDEAIAAANKTWLESTDDGFQLPRVRTVVARGGSSGVAELAGDEAEIPIGRGVEMHGAVLLDPPKPAARSLVVADRLPARGKQTGTGAFDAEGDVVVHCDVVEEATGKRCGWHAMGARKEVAVRVLEHRRLYHIEDVMVMLLNHPLR